MIHRHFTIGHKEIRMGLKGREHDSHGSNHNETDSPLYYIQLGRLPPIAGVSRFNSNIMLFHLTHLLVTYK
jgi:hypothetical protein